MIFFWIVITIIVAIFSASIGKIDLDLIKIDPYYQLIYGENSHFSVDFKIKILKAIKEYSSENPYFLDSNSYFLKDELIGFYVFNEKFDEFLIEEFEIAIKLKNHYIYVFEMIFTSNQDKLSKKLKKFLFKKMFDQHLVVRVKEKLLQSNIFNISQKKKILEAIKGNKISDKTIH
jgi:predicted nucleic-acid-binding protein